MNSSESLTTSLLQTRTPLGVTCSPSGAITIVAGETIELSITVSNDGGHSAIIDIQLDPRSQLRHWCTVSQESLALNPGESSEVFFELQVPPNTLADDYDYTIILNAPQHYPETTPIYYAVGHLQVTTSIQEMAEGNTPTFGIMPATTSAMPLVIVPGEPLSLQVSVENRSNQVDSFRITCPDLPKEWLEILYPQSITPAGMVVPATTLELNPDDHGLIELLLTPPLPTTAGIYAPTLHLHSINQPDFELLDVVYLQVMPRYELTVDLVRLVNQITQPTRVGQLQFHNLGNASRTLRLHAEAVDQNHLGTYTLSSEQVNLAPNQTAQVALLLTPPSQWWKRSFTGRPLPYLVILDDVEQQPLVIDRFQGEILWAPRPWWQLLLLILLLLGFIGTLALALWWLLTRPPTQPQILEFSSARNILKAEEEQAVRLSWTIENPQAFDRLQLIGRSSEGTVISGPFRYDFSEGVPEVLEPFCVLKKKLRCQQVPTDARKAGQYVFELSLSKGDAATEPFVAQTDTVVIEPLPRPRILTLLPSPTSITADHIHLDWQIAHAKQIKQLRLVGRSPEDEITIPLEVYDFSQGVPKTLERKCRVSAQRVLRCDRVPTGARTAGTYVFELTVVPRQDPPPDAPVPVIAQKTDPIKIKARFQPTEIEAFTVQGKPALPKYVLNFTDATQQTLKFAWQVKGGAKTQVNLLPAPGPVQPKGQVVLPFSPATGSQTITLQVTTPEGKQLQRAVTIEALPLAPAMDATESAAVSPASLPSETPSVGAASSGTSPSGPSGAEASPAPSADSAPSQAVSSPAEAPAATSPPVPAPLPDPPGASQPLPAGRNAPPPQELPPRVN